MWTEKPIEDKVAKAQACLDEVEDVLFAAGVFVKDTGEGTAHSGEAGADRERMKEQELCGGKDKVIPPKRLHEKRSVLKAREENSARQEWNSTLQRGQACIRAARQDLEKRMANRPEGQDVHQMQTLLDDAMKYTQSCIAMSSLAAKEAALHFTAAAARAENVPVIPDDGAAKNA